MRVRCAFAALLALLALPSGAGAETYLGDLRSWELPPRPDGYGQYVKSIDVGPQGTVYAVGDANLVYAYTREGVFIRAWDPRASVDPPYNGTGDLAAGADGNVWVAVHSSIRRFNADGTLLEEYPSEDVDSLARAADGGVWAVADGHLFHLAKDGTTRTRAGYASTGYSGRIAADSHDRVYIGVPQPGGRYGTSRIERSDLDGATPYRFYLPYGERPGEISDYGTGRGVAVDPSGNVWITDSGGFRVQAFTPDAEFILGCGSPTRLSIFDYSIGDVAIGPAGEPYVVGGRAIHQLGQVSWPAPTCAPPPPLRITGIRVRPGSFRIALHPRYLGRGGALRFVLSEPAQVYVQVLRRGTRGRFLFQTSFYASGRAGLNVVRLNGWYALPGIGTGPGYKAYAPLPPGDYKATLFAQTANGVRAADGNNPALSTRFRIIR